jgi:hypothetical protein
MVGKKYVVSAGCLYLYCKYIFAYKNKITWPSQYVLIYLWLPDKWFQHVSVEDWKPLKPVLGGMRDIAHYDYL